MSKNRHPSHNTFLDERELIPKPPTLLQQVQQKITAAKIELHYVSIGYSDPQHQTFIIFVRSNKPEYLFKAIHQKLIEIFKDDVRVAVHPESLGTFTAKQSLTKNQSL
jgi:hypothetical protein